MKTERPYPTEDEVRAGLHPSLRDKFIYCPQGVPAPDGLLDWTPFVRGLLAIWREEKAVTHDTE